MSTAKDTDVFIVGPAYSGSTLLGNALNGHPDVSHVGEIARLPFFDRFNNPWESCAVCERGAMEGRNRACPVWNPAVKSWLQDAGPQGALQILREVTRSPVIVDGSKDLDWLRRVYEVGVRELTGKKAVRVILTVRHPLAYVSTCKRRTQMPVWQAANIWRDTIYDAFRTVSRLGFPVTIVRYEDLALAPEPVLRNLCDFIGIDYSPQMLEFWNKPVHPIGGNAGAFVWYPHYQDYIERGAYEVEADRAVSKVYATRSFGGWVDDKWRDHLADWEVTSVMTTPSLMDMVSMVGYDAGQFRLPLRVRAAEPAPAEPQLAADDAIKEVLPENNHQPSGESDQQNIVSAKSNSA